MTFSPWITFLLFLAWGIFSFSKAWARQRRYRCCQRDHWLIADTFEHGIMALALLGSAARNGTHPLSIFQTEQFRSLIILAWLVAFIPLIIGNILDWHSLARIEQERGWKYGR